MREQRDQRRLAFAKHHGPPADDDECGGARRALDPLRAAPRETRRRTHRRAPGARRRRERSRAMSPRSSKRHATFCGWSPSMPVPGGKVRRAAEHQVETLVGAQRGGIAEVAVPDLVARRQARCRRPTSAPAARCRPALRSSRTARRAGATPQSSRPNRCRSRGRAPRSPTAPSSSRTTPSARRRSRSDGPCGAGRCGSDR